MTGIDFDNLDDLIKKNNFNFDSLNSDIKAFKLCLDELDNCYSGNSMNTIFNELSRQDNNLKKILDVIQKYSEVLNGIKTSYKHQDEELQYLFNHLNIQ